MQKCPAFSAASTPSPAFAAESAGAPQAMESYGVSVCSATTRSKCVRTAVVNRICTGSTHCTLAPNRKLFSVCGLFFVLCKTGADCKTGQ
eukprot:637768-Amphidinium_carterae.1